MLVWLASYPRSGNTLLRLILGQCLGLESFDAIDVPDLGETEPDREPWQRTRQGFGFRLPPPNREAFLASARKSRDLVLVKTHYLPSDAERTIYVVRDGRLALPSFHSFIQTYSREPIPFSALLLGDHFYRDWSTHHRAWCEQRSGPLLVLRFEELTQATPTLVAQIATFIGHEGPINPWVNPQKQLQHMIPCFFGNGATSWGPDAFWNESRLRQFYTLHGDLLARLGYATTTEVAQGALPPGSPEEELLVYAREMVERKWDLQRAADERLGVIERLQTACQERLALIERLDRQLQAVSRSSLA